MPPGSKCCLPFFGPLYWFATSSKTPARRPAAPGDPWREVLPTAGPRQERQTAASLRNSGQKETVSLRSEVAGTRRAPRARVQAQTIVVEVLAEGGPKYDGEVHRRLSAVATKVARRLERSSRCTFSSFACIPLRCERIMSFECRPLPRSTSYLCCRRH